MVREGFLFIFHYYDFWYIFFKIAATKASTFVKSFSKRFATDLEYDIEKRKPIVSRMKQMVNNNGINDVYTQPPNTVVIAQGRKVKTSLRRHEQKADEFYEL